MEYEKIENIFYDREDHELPVYTDTFYRATSSDGGWEEFKSFMSALEHVIKERNPPGWEGTCTTKKELFKFFNKNIVIIRRSQIGNPYCITMVEHEQLWPENIKETKNEG